MEPKHVILYNYAAGKNPGKGEYQRFDALVIGSRQLEGSDKPSLNVAYFDHLDIAAHHALQGIDWSDTIHRMLDVPHQGDVQQESFYWTETEASDKEEIAELQTKLTIAVENHGQLGDADAKLKAFLMDNFKSETGDETPVDCAIRLLTKARAKDAKPEKGAKAEK